MRFNRLSWSRAGSAAAEEFSLGLMAGGLVDGSMNICGNSYAGIRALHCNVRINSHAFYSSCSPNGRRQCQGDKARVKQTLLLMSGRNTLLQTFIRSRLPTVMNASFAFLIPVMSIIRDFALLPFADEHERFLHTMRAIQGALIVSSFLNIIIGYSKAWGNYTRLCSPVVIVPVVGVVGLGLFERGFPEVGKCVEIGLPMLILLVSCQQYLKNIHERAHSLLESFEMLSAL